MPRFVHEYLRGAASAQGLLPHRFDRPADRAAAVEAARARPVRAPVLDALRAQNAALAPSEARERHLDALGAGAAAVVTGQQVGLFGGPLYTVYKAASAIVTARALQAEHGHPVAPVFWLQTEDHDLPEIGTAWVPDREGAPQAVPVSEDADNRVSVAHLALGPAVEAALDTLGAHLDGLPEAADTLARLRRCYRPEATWADAFAQWLSELFAPEGLILIDPRQGALVAESTAVHRRAIEDHAAIAAGLTERVTALRAADLGVPVHVRDGAPLSFLHPEGATGPRARFEACEGGWRLIGAAGAAGAASPLPARMVSGALERAAGELSTSALLRPILQDSLLPTVAYVGGPGEIDYFAQLAPLYAAYDLPMPLVVPRARFTVSTPRQVRLRNKLGLSLEGLSQPEAEVLRAAAATPEHAALRASLLEGFEAHLSALRPELQALDPNLVKAADRTEETVRRAVDKLLTKHEAALIRRDADLARHVRQLRGWLAPGGAPQERRYALATFGARHGDRAFVTQVLDATEPYVKEAKELVL